MAYMIFDNRTKQVIKKRATLGDLEKTIERLLNEVSTSIKVTQCNSKKGRTAVITCISFGYFCGEVELYKSDGDKTMHHEDIEYGDLPTIIQWIKNKLRHNERKTRKGHLIYKVGKRKKTMKRTPWQ